MDRFRAVTMLSALGQDTRLEAIELLLRNEPAGLLAGEVARRLHVPQNTMSAHLATLSRAGLVEAERQGRSVVYRVRPRQLSALASYLEQDCGSNSAPGPAGIEGGDE